MSTYTNGMTYEFSDSLDFSTSEFGTLIGTRVEDDTTYYQSECKSECKSKKEWFRFIRAANYGPENSDSPANPSKVELDRDSNTFKPFQFENNGFISSGLTKREHFAGMAMQGILSSKHVMDFAKENEVELMDKAIAMTAVNYADALLKELEK